MQGVSRRYSYRATFFPIKYYFVKWKSELPYGNTVIGMKMSAATKQLYSPANEHEPINCRPFVKWVGGKSQLIAELRARVPDKIGTYYEPFIGGGALFFALQPPRAVLSDLNEELINAYTIVRDQPSALIRNLRLHRYDREYFYSIRNADRFAAFRRWSAVRRAARFVFLNKTCFNGLYRVNSQGHYNTPFGRYVRPRIVDEPNLRACSAALTHVTLRVCSFLDIERSVKKDDFVYFDPPYVPLSATSSFTQYSRERFDLDMQRALFELCCRLDKRGVRFMLSNSSAPFVIELYKKFSVERIGASRSINSKASARGKIDEVVVTNFR